MLREKSTGKYLTNNKNGFTMIELIVSLIVLGTFMLLAAPKLLQFVNVADEVAIQSDIRFAENLSVLEIYKNGFDLANSQTENNVVLASEIENAVSNGLAYNVQGKIESMDSIGNEEFFELDSNFLENELRTNLNGRFLSTNDARVIYIEEQKEKQSLADKANELKVALFDKNANDSYDLASSDVADVNELFEDIDINNADELLNSYTSLLSSIK